MARYTTQQIRGTLAVMERGKGIAYFNNVCVTFNPSGYFNVFNGTSHCKHSCTQSVKEAVEHVKICLH